MTDDAKGGALGTRHPVLITDYRWKPKEFLPWLRMSLITN